MLTRAKAKSGRYAVVVRFTRSRHRYERQGLLVEPQAAAEARRDLEPCDADKLLWESTNESRNDEEAAPDRF
jgi:hypothetical protein